MSNIISGAGGGAQLPNLGGTPGAQGASPQLTGADALLARPSALGNLLGNVASAATSVQTHVVNAGETLADIATQHGSSPSVLSQLNNLVDPQRLSIGQVLRLPGEALSTVAHTVADVASSVGDTITSTLDRLADPAVRTLTSTISTLSPNGLDRLFNQEAVKGVTDRLHISGDGSVRLGAGYDMSNRSPEQIIRDLIAIGVNPRIAAQLAQGAGLLGPAARAFVATYVSLLILTAGQERQLLGFAAMPVAKEIAGKVDVPLTQAQFDTLVSLSFASGKTSLLLMIMRLLSAGDLAAAAAAMNGAAAADRQAAQLASRRGEVQLAQTPDGALHDQGGSANVDRSASNARPDAGAVATTPADYARIIEKHGDDLAKADLAAGRKVVVALRTPTATDAVGPNIFDDRVAVVWKAPDGRYRAETFAGNTRPATDGIPPREGDLTAIPPNILAEGTLRYRQQPDQLMGAIYFRADSVAAAGAAKPDTNALRLLEPPMSSSGVLLHPGGVSATEGAAAQTLAREDYNGFLRALDGQPAFSYVLVGAR